jgi:regulator of protease activity HflC (stomatin/prohibitin superfamily)
MRAPASLRDLVLYLLSAWAFIGVIAGVASLFSLYAAVVAGVLFIAATAATLRQLWLLLHARHRVLSQKQVSLLWGMVHLISWDPTEGVLVLRDKDIAFSDDDLHDARGGVRFLYPILGEELALRVPLEVQTLRFADDSVLTRDYLSLMVRGTMKWRITNVRDFYLLVSRELRSTGDENGAIRTSASTRQHQTGDGNQEQTLDSLLKSAIEWLRVIAEEQTRLVVSRVSSGLLLADRIASEMPELRTTAPALAAPAEFGGTADGLAQSIFQAVRARVSEFGLAVTDVSLQEIRLPDEVVKRCIEACQAAFLPLLAERRAAGRRAELKTEVDLLGREAVGAREIVGAAPAFTLTDFLSNFLKQQLPAVGMVGAMPAAAALAAVAGTAPAALPPAEAKSS